MMKYSQPLLCVLTPSTAVCAAGTSAASAFCFPTGAAESANDCVSGGNTSCTNGSTNNGYQCNEGTAANECNFVGNSATGSNCVGGGDN